MQFLGSKSVLHHFKICFPIPLEKVQSCLKKIEAIDRSKTSAVCVSFNGHCQSPENSQLLYESLLNAREIKRLSIFTFLESKATALAYFTATAGQSITINPYSIIGDIGAPQKSYRNIKKLLDILGIKYEQLGSQHKSSKIWNQFVQKTEREEQITQKWLQIVQNNMINSISQRRSLPKEDLLDIKSRIMHPRDALRLKLVDSVSTFEEFADVNFPNSPIEDYTYRIEGMRFGNSPSKKEMHVITNFFEILAMPQVALFSSNDPLMESMAELFSLLDSRLQSGSDLESLDFWLESFFTSMKGEQSYQGMTFQL